MNNLIKSIKYASIIEAINVGSAKLMRDEEGAQIVEYALIIAVVSIGLVILLSTLLGGTSNPFSNFVARVGTCLTTAACI